MQNGRRVAIGVGILAALAGTALVASPAQAVVVPEATVHVTKDVIDFEGESIAPEDWPADWSFEVAIDPEPIEADSSAVLDGSTPSVTWVVPTGEAVYTISEPQVDPRFTLDSIACTLDGDEVADGDVEQPGFQLAPLSGGEYFCSVVNAGYASGVHVGVTTVGGDGTFDFLLGGAIEPVGHEVTTSAGSGDTYYAPLPPSTYSIAEQNVPAGWTSSGLSCTTDAGDEVVEVDPAEFELGIDEWVDCTVTYTNSMPATTSPAKPGLAETGAPSGAILPLGVLLLVAGSAALLLIRRRTADRAGSIE